MGRIYNDLDTGNIHTGELEGNSSPRNKPMIDLLDTREDLHTLKGRPVEDVKKGMLEGIV